MSSPIHHDDLCLMLTNIWPIIAISLTRSRTGTVEPVLKENFSLKCKIPATGDVCVVGGNNIYTTAAPPSGKKAPPGMFANMQIEGKFHKLQTSIRYLILTCTCFGGAHGEIRQKQMKCASLVPSTDLPNNFDVPAYSIYLSNCAVFVNFASALGHFNSAGL